jgi:hypothetical protein
VRLNCRQPDALACKLASQHTKEHKLQLAYTEAFTTHLHPCRTEDQFAHLAAAVCQCMLLPQLVEHVCCVKACVVAQLAWDGLQRLCVRVDEQLRLAGDGARVVTQRARQLQAKQRDNGSRESIMLAVPAASACSTDKVMCRSPSRHTVTTPPVCKPQSKSLAQLLTSPVTRPSHQAAVLAAAQPTITIRLWLHPLPRSSHQVPSVARHSCYQSSRFQHKLTSKHD